MENPWWQVFEWHPLRVALEESRHENAVGQEMISRERYCISCGNVVREDWVFCIKCGEKIKASDDRKSTDSTQSGSTIRESGIVCSEWGGIFGQDDIVECNDCGKRETSIS